MKTLALVAALGIAVGVAPACTGDGSSPDGTLTLAEPGSPFVAVDVWVNAGSQNDPAGKEGLAYLTAQLLSDGSTEQDSYQAIIEKLYPMAAGYGASVDKEMTVFQGVVHVDNLEAWYGLFRNALLSPAFSEEDFNRVKAQLLNYVERGRRFNRDEELSKELLYWMAYQGTPYAHPVEGYVASVRSITLDDVRDFYTRFYARDNVVVAVGGGHPDGFVKRVRADFDALPEGTVQAVEAPRPVMPEGVKVLIVEKQTDASAISLGFPIPLLRGDDDFIAMSLVNAWFGEHRSSFSHLYQVIREQRGMNYGDYSYIEPFPRGFATQQRPVNYGRRSNLFEIWIRPISGTGPDDLHDRTLFATRAAWRELDALVEKGLPADQVERARLYLHNFSVTYGSTVSRRLAYRIDDAYFGLPDPGYLASIRPGLAELTPESVKAGIDRNLQSANMWVVFVTSDAHALKAKLLSGEPTFIRYAGEQPPEVVAEDDDIANFPIPVTEDDVTILDIQEVFERGS
jgi:zinc protease